MFCFVCCCCCCCFLSIKHVCSGSQQHDLASTTGIVRRAPTSAESPQQERNEERGGKGKCGREGLRRNMSKAERLSRKHFRICSWNCASASKRRSRQVGRATSGDCNLQGLQNTVYTVDLSQRLLNAVCPVDLSQWLQNAVSTVDLSQGLQNTVCTVDLSQWLQNAVSTVDLRQWLQNKVSTVDLSQCLQNAVSTVDLRQWLQNKVSTVDLSQWLQNAVSTVDLNQWLQNAVSTVDDATNAMNCIHPGTASTRATSHFPDQTEDELGDTTVMCGDLNVRSGMWDLKSKNPQGKALEEALGDVIFIPLTVPLPRRLAPRQGARTAPLNQGDTDSTTEPRRHGQHH